MKKIKTIVMLCCISCLLLVSFSGTLTADEEEDYIWYRKIDPSDETSFVWEKYTEGDKDYLYITDLSYEESDDQIIVTLSLKEPIIDHVDVYYRIYLESDNESTDYYAFYVNRFERINDLSPGYYTESKAGDSEWVVTFNVDGSFNLNDVWCTAHEYTSWDETDGEYWGHWKPITYFPEYDIYYDDDDDENGDENGNGDENDVNETNGGTKKDEDNGTPGFGIIAFVSAVAVMLIVFNKRKHKKNK